jgi:hypothetical protein
VLSFAGAEFDIKRSRYVNMDETVTYRHAIIDTTSRNRSDGCTESYEGLNLILELAHPPTSTLLALPKLASRPTPESTLLPPLVPAMFNSLALRANAMKSIFGTSVVL